MLNKTYLSVFMSILLIGVFTSVTSVKTEAQESSFNAGNDQRKKGEAEISDQKVKTAEGAVEAAKRAYKEKIGMLHANESLGRSNSIILSHDIEGFAESGERIWEVRNTYNSGRDAGAIIIYVHPVNEKVHFLTLPWERERAYEYLRKANNTEEKIAQMEQYLVARRTVALNLMSILRDSGLSLETRQNAAVRIGALQEDLLVPEILSIVTSANVDEDYLTSDTVTDPGVIALSGYGPGVVQDILDVYLSTDNSKHRFLLRQAIMELKCHEYSFSSPGETIVYYCLLERIEQSDDTDTRAELQKIMDAYTQRHKSTLAYILSSVERPSQDPVD